MTSETGIHSKAMITGHRDTIRLDRLIAAAKRAKATPRKTHSPGKAARSASRPGKIVPKVQCGRQKPEIDGTTEVGLPSPPNKDCRR